MGKKYRIFLIIAKLTGGTRNRFLDDFCGVKGSTFKELHCRRHAFEEGMHALDFDVYPW
jgi:hypothetical protein